MNRVLPLIIAYGVSCFGILMGADLDSLLNRSPFLPDGYVDPKDRKPEEVKTPERPSNWELRGWTTLGDITKVSMFNKAEKKSYWINVNDPNAEVRIVELDKISKEVNLSINGKTETIALAKSTFSEATSRPQPAPRPAPPKPNESQQAQETQQQAGETKRRVIPRRRVVVPRRTN